MKRVPKRTSTKSLREFWDVHDAIEVFGEHGRKIAEPGSGYVNSIYVSKVGPKGAVVRVPKEWLRSIGATKGRKIKASIRGKRLVMELA
jgi:hypothetical protein